MHTVGQLVSARRRELRLTMQRLADLVGIAKSYLWLIEHDRRSPPADDLLHKLEAALDLPRGTLIHAARWQATPADVRREVSQLHSAHKLGQRLAEILSESGVSTEGQIGDALDRAYRSGELKRLIDRLAPENTEDAPAGAASLPKRSAAALPLSSTLPLEVPLINKVAAGYPTEFTDLGYPARVADEYVRSPDINDPDAFACRVVGDSMLPDYREGDIVIFSPARTVKSGMDCFARIEPDHESTFKRIYFEGDSDRGDENGEISGQLIRLQPLNPVYPARVYPREQVAGLYAAVSVTRAIG
jgi:repressor LexA